MGRNRARAWIGLAAGAAIGSAAAVGYVRHRLEINFYGRLLRLYLVGRRFARSYPYAVRNVAYSSMSPERLDVYSPEAGDGHPVAIFVHGGAWKNYRKELFAPAAMRLVPENMVVVIPDYTLYPQAGYAQMASEVAAATAWTLENIAAYRGDPHRVVLAGHSAGGHLIGLVGLDERYLRACGHSPAELTGLIGLSGVYDLWMQHDYNLSTWGDSRILCAVMGGKANFDAASPMTYVRPDTPPILLIHGENDAIVPAGIGVAFQAALERAGAPSRLLLYPGAGHTDYLLAALGDVNAQIMRDLRSFMDGAGAGGPTA